ncbi:hypothetical protein E1287_04460 [Actinomadura sp. KC06]|uniref:hypothetical protein n=1 Tax=Actinomadura sp. KC06 TaxID=2530369 RepID=UPI00104C215E|nr:hypothetical protein [Actinomadura sp. KC06]TDD39062.1 hypothetical protein E1287_04460 [Actinomadura sp. KC06]
MTGEPLTADPPLDEGRGRRDDSAVLRSSLREPERFGQIFDAYFAEIHGYAAKRLGPDAEMKPGFVIEYQASRSAGWTDAKPKPPAGLPF